MEGRGGGGFVGGGAVVGMGSRFLSTHQTNIYQIASGFP